jgi:hypothetical protein
METNHHFLNQDYEMEWQKDSIYSREYEEVENIKQQGLPVIISVEYESESKSLPLGRVNKERIQSRRNIPSKVDTGWAGYFSYAGE